MKKLNWVLEKERRHYQKEDFSKGLRIFHNLCLDMLKNMEPQPSQKTSLELGCADGNFLDELRKLGMKVYGIEIVPEFLEACNKKGLEVIEHDLNAGVPFKDEMFDYVFAFDVIEHLFEFRRCLLDSWRVLKKGGFFFMTVPNICYYKYILQLILGRSPPMLYEEPDVVYLSCKQWKKLLEEIYDDVKSIKSYKIFKLFLIETCFFVAQKGVDE
jgi:methionine biosynthesis protein MetW